MEPIAYRMSVVAGTAGSSFPDPYALAYASCPCLTTATDALGTPVARRTCIAIESTFVLKSCAGARDAEAIDAMQMKAGRILIFGYCSTVFVVGVAGVVSIGGCFDRRHLCKRSQSLPAMCPNARPASPHVTPAIATMPKKYQRPRTMPPVST